MSQRSKTREITRTLLFSLFINEFAKNIINNGTRGIQLPPDMTELFILLFADAIVHLSDPTVGMQNQLGVLARNCARHDLILDYEKIKHCDFQKWGIQFQDRKKGSMIGKQYTC